MKILFLNQTFYPDEAATAQHASDLARQLVREGHEVTALAGRRAYGRPGVIYPAEEEREGVRIHRVGAIDFGKQARWRRALNFASFLVAAAWRLARMPRPDVVVAMTSPPLVTVLGAAFTGWKGGRLVTWIMDLNPDEAIAAGWLKPRSAAARGLRVLMDWSLRRADTVITLDRFMAERIGSRVDARILVVPPGARGLRYDEAGRRAWRRMHGMEDKFVVMYSGNHSPCHPLGTLLAAAERLRDDGRFVFCFVGGGSEQPKVAEFARARGLENIRALPYEPEETLAAALSAADLHAVVMGDAFVGILHPSKIYNVMAVGIPVLYIGPEQSHVTDIGAGQPWFHPARHGQVERVVEQIRRAFESPRGRQPECEARFSQPEILDHLVSAIGGHNGISGSRTRTGVREATGAATLE